MSLMNRKRTAVGKMSMQKEFPKMDFEQAIDLFISGKSAEELRPRTLRDYKKDYWGYFVKWLNENYEIDYIDELTPHIFRDYINYLKYDAKKYEGHSLLKMNKELNFQTLQ